MTKLQPHDSVKAPPQNDLLTQNGFRLHLAVIWRKRNSHGVNRSLCRLCRSGMYVQKSTSAIEILLDKNYLVLAN